MISLQPALHIFFSFLSTFGVGIIESCCEELVISHSVLVSKEIGGKLKGKQHLLQFTNYL